MFQFTGNVGKDAEVKSVGGKSVIEYSVAVYAGKDKDGNNQTLWVNCGKWLAANQQANALDMPKKGDLVLVNCRPNPVRVYTTNSGVQGASLDVFVNQLEILRKSGESAAQTSSSPKEAQATTTPVSLPASQSFSDDLPF
jgi:single-stranded DNA-binding protein